MDKINATLYLEPSKTVVLEHLKAMNKKFAFTVVLKGLKRMGAIRGFRTFAAMIVAGSS